jgi:ADP-ribose pyrophosphatase YjhB (NUDIX family)
MKFITKSIYNLARLKWFFTRPMSIGVRILLLQDIEILLVKHTYQNHWYLPGGGVKKKETLEQAIKRECKEEIGAELYDIQIFGAYSNFYEYKNDHIIVFSCSNFSLKQKKNTEIEMLKFFNINSLPKDISPGSYKRISEYVNKEYPKHDRW